MARWQESFGAPLRAKLMEGDAAGNGAVDGNDLLIWQWNVTPTASTSAIQVPEPLFATWLLIASFGLVTRKRHEVLAHCA
jgi:hypothetical protein